MIFPEGGRSRDGELHAFKEGAAYIAIKAHVPLVPITVVGTRKVLAVGSATFRRAHVRLYIGDPISTKGLAVRDRETLTASAREQIAAMLEKYS